MRCLRKRIIIETISVEKYLDDDLPLYDAISNNQLRKTELETFALKLKFMKVDFVRCNMKSNTWIAQILQIIYN